MHAHPPGVETHNTRDHITIPLPKAFRVVLKAGTSPVELGESLIVTRLKPAARIESMQAFFVVRE